MKSSLDEQTINLDGAKPPNEETQEQDTPVTEVEAVVALVTSGSRNGSDGGDNSMSASIVSINEPSIIMLD